MIPLVILLAIVCLIYHLKTAHELAKIKSGVEIAADTLEKAGHMAAQTSSLVLVSVSNYLKTLL